MDFVACSFLVDFYSEFHNLFSDVFTNAQSLFSRQPGRGYPLPLARVDAASSFLVSGAYMGIEPSVIPQKLWISLLQQVCSRTSLEPASLKQVRVQLNKYGGTSSVHPLALYPHTDSAPDSLSPVFVNIPIESESPVITKFYRFIPTQKTYPVNDLFDTVGAKRSHSPLTLTEYLKDNRQYTNSEVLKLSKWEETGSLSISAPYAGCFTSDHFHAPYISSDCSLRNTLAIFLYFDPSYTPPAFTSLDTDFQQILIRSFSVVNDEPLSVI